MNNQITVKVKALDPRASLPYYANHGDAGLDLKAISKEYTEDHKLVMDTGLAFEIPYGHVGLIFPRSSIHKTNNRLTNCVGVIDSSYRGSVKFVFDVSSDFNNYNIGDKVGQLIIMPYPQVQLVFTDTLSETDRGSSGFGSTGR